MSSLTKSATISKTWIGDSSRHSKSSSGEKRDRKKCPQCPFESSEWVCGLATLKSKGLRWLQAWYWRSAQRCSHAVGDDTLSRTSLLFRPSIASPTGRLEQRMRWSKRGYQRLGDSARDTGAPTKTCNETKQKPFRSSTAAFCYPIDSCLSIEKYLKSFPFNIFCETRREKSFEIKLNNFINRTNFFIKGYPSCFM